MQHSETKCMETSGAKQMEKVRFVSADTYVSMLEFSNHTCRKKLFVVDIISRLEESRCLMNYRNGVFLM